jgi:hypothetical protein
MSSARWVWWLTTSAPSAAAFRRAPPGASGPLTASLVAKPPPNPSEHYDPQNDIHHLGNLQLVVALLVGFPQHPDYDRPERPVLLAVDQQLGGGASRAISPVRPMTSRNVRRIVRRVSRERGTTPEYPDLRRQDMSRFVSAAPPPDLSQHDMDRIAGERSREDDALEGHKKTSLWKRHLGRRSQ